MTNAVRFGCLFLWLLVLGGCHPGRAVLPPGTMTELDRNQYSDNMSLLAHHFPGDNRPGKLQMMAIGDRRYLFQFVFPGENWDWVFARGEILDVTDPLHPVVVNDFGFRGYSINLAWHAPSSRWILMEVQGTFGDPYDWAPGPRGFRLLDVTDPTEVTVISSFSTDGGDPSRIWQGGSGTHRDYWDGGRYAYVGAADRDAYYPEREHGMARYSRSLRIIDMLDPAQPKEVGRWWVPGQRRDEEDARSKWRSRNDPLAYDNFHGPMYVPKKVEEGGRYGYGGWGAFGVLIHDVSNPSAPSLVGHWDTDSYIPGPVIPHHTVDVTRLDRGFVITTPEAIATECQEAWHESHLLDVEDPMNIRWLASLPSPTPPSEAPYDDFCQKPGRFGPHNAAHLKAPGRPDPNFAIYTYFNAGVQAFDLSDPRDPKISGYFIPEQGGRMENPESYERGTDSVFVEWDRRLVWVASNTGLYLLATPLLGDPVLGALEVEEWSLPGLNAGHP